MTKGRNASVTCDAALHSDCNCSTCSQTALDLKPGCERRVSKTLKLLWAKTHPRARATAARRAPIDVGRRARRIARIARVGSINEFDQLDCRDHAGWARARVARVGAQLAEQHVGERVAAHRHLLLACRWRTNSVLFWKI